MRTTIRAAFAVAAATALLAAPASASAERGGDRDRGHRASTTIAVAGDIACTPGEQGAPPNGQPNGPDNCQQPQTAELVQSLNPDAVATPGDIQYQFGHYSEFLGSFDPTWGQFKSKIFPAAGNHEWYDQPNGAGYFDYFNGIGAPDGRAGVRSQGYYSVDLSPRWHLITLNSNCTSDNTLITQPVPCGQGSPQERWLRADLAAHRGQCIIAQWHHPLYTSGSNQGGPNDLATQSFWEDLYAGGATMVWNGHDHDYERFAPQDDQGQVDLRRGVREFVLGTGGKSLFSPAPPRPAANSQVFADTTYGVTLFGLHRNSYDWRFYRESVAGNGTFVDQGSARCNRAGRDDNRDARGGRRGPRGLGGAARA